MQSPLRIGFAAPGSVMSEPSAMAVDETPSLSGSLPMDVEPSSGALSQEEIDALFERERARGNPYLDKIFPLQPGQEPRPGFQRMIGQWTVYDRFGNPMKQF